MNNLFDIAGAQLPADVSRRHPALDLTQDVRDCPSVNFDFLIDSSLIRGPLPSGLLVLAARVFWGRRHVRDPNNMGRGGAFSERAKPRKTVDNWHDTRVTESLCVRQ